MAGHHRHRPMRDRHSQRHRTKFTPRSTNHACGRNLPHTRRPQAFLPRVSPCYNSTSMATPKENALRKQLEAEGFSGTYVWQDGPRASYPDHTHAELTAHIILDGEMTLTMEGRSETYRQGDRCDVPARTVHSARMGTKGCRYLVGEK